MIDETGEEIYISFTQYIPSFKYKVRLSSPFYLRTLPRACVYADKRVSAIRAKEFNAEDAWPELTRQEI